MPAPTPFYPRQRELCLSHLWKEWAGYHAPRSFGPSPEREYNAIRQGAALLDVTPLYKYDLTGSGAGALLSRIAVRDVAKLAVGRMTYLCWCDDDGKVIDDGTCARLDAEHYRLTSAAPALWWLSRHGDAYDVSIDDLSDRMAALALQGPTSRDVLREVCDADLDQLAFFGVAPTRFAGGDGWLSRTGYTGDLGYELWIDGDRALPLWDALVAAGKRWGLEPIGLDALDISRIEAGFILRGVDYVPADEALIDAQKSSPFEIGLGWTVKLEDRNPPFIGQRALEEERRRGSTWAVVGLDIDWPAVEGLYARHGLPPHVPAAAWRTAVPVYQHGRQVGRATSGTWSPLLKKNLAIATVEAACATPGTELAIEWTIEWARETAPAIVTKTPFFDPERKRKP